MEVASAVEGLKRLSAHPYDVLLTDVRMPGISGLELVERVLEHNSALGVILLTASARDLEPARRRLGSPSSASRWRSPA
jgi:CheY-like chemotaxis protein